MSNFSDIGAAFDTLWVDETSHICRLVTSRTESGKLNPNVITVRDYIFDLANKFNQTQTSLKFSTFQWCIEDLPEKGFESNDSPTDDEVLNAKFSVFGLRLGSDQPAYKMVAICHLDTVSAAEDGSWSPFSPSIETREYPEGTKNPQSFLVGRGCIDDKGPAISAFLVARCVAKALDGTSHLDNIQIDFLFDTSEETEMSTPVYLGEDHSKLPDFGVVYDASWIVRAEKGAERPKFIVNPSAKSPPAGSIYVTSLITTPTIPTNTIADWAEATICGDLEQLSEFAECVGEQYATFCFDDPDYRRAELTSELSSDGSTLTLRTKVAGAQHGSAPEQNREKGANPLVSLANFIAGLARSEKLAATPSVSIACFIADTWGTHVFGEGNDDLYKYDEIFVKGNGTTYAITKTSMDVEGVEGSIQLELDIRYSIGHHEHGWSEDLPEGFLPGDLSIFSSIFTQIVDNFNKTNSSLSPVTFKTATIFPPDVRKPETNEHFHLVDEAYARIMGHPAPKFAAGGGTDAKGFPFLLGAGPLFAMNMGYPINYHGVGEGAPIEDMKKSTEIMYSIFEQEITSFVKKGANRSSKRTSMEAMRRVKLMMKKGYRPICSC